TFGVGCGVHARWKVARGWARVTSSRHSGLRPEDEIVALVGVPATGLGPPVLIGACHLPDDPDSGTPSMRRPLSTGSLGHLGGACKQGQAHLAVRAPTTPPMIPPANANRGVYSHSSGTSMPLCGKPGCPAAPWTNPTVPPTMRPTTSPVAVLDRRPGQSRPPTMDDASRPSPTRRKLLDSSGGMVGATGKGT